VKTGAEGDGPSTNVMEIGKPDDLADIARLGDRAREGGLSLAEARLLAGGGPTGDRRCSGPWPRPSSPGLSMWPRCLPGRGRPEASDRHAFRSAHGAAARSDTAIKVALSYLKVRKRHGFSWAAQGQILQVLRELHVKVVSILSVVKRGQDGIRYFAGSVARMRTTNRRYALILSFFPAPGRSRSVRTGSDWRSGGQRW
jgi:hypothetical protein